jgi:hypothetical protein
MAATRSRYLNGRGEERRDGVGWREKEEEERSLIIMINPFVLRTHMGYLVR